MKNTSSKPKKETEEQKQMSENEEVSLKFFIQQLLDIGDLFGTFIIFIVLREMDAGTFAQLKRDHARLFMIEVGGEIILEFIWMLSIIPLIKRFTMIKDFKPSAAALPVLKKDLIYLALLSIITYPTTLYMLLV